MSHGALRQAGPDREKYAAEQCEPDLPELSQDRKIDAPSRKDQSSELKRPTFRDDVTAATIAIGSTQVSHVVRFPLCRLLQFQLSGRPEAMVS
jgi:hypothetical protein